MTRKKHSWKKDMNIVGQRPKKDDNHLKPLSVEKIELSSKSWPSERSVVRVLVKYRPSGDRVALKYRPSVGRHAYRLMSVDTRPILHRHSAASRPPLRRYFTNTQPTLRSLDQFLLPSSIFPALLREAFSGRRPFLAFNSGNIHVFFPAMFFPRHPFYIRPLLLSDAAAFANCCFWRLVILGEQKMI